jgi:hypothetical protein
VFDLRFVLKLDGAGVVLRELRTLSSVVEKVALEALGQVCQQQVLVLVISLPTSLQLILASLVQLKVTVSLLIERVRPQIAEKATSL